MRFIRTAALAAALSLAPAVAFAGSLPACPTGPGVIGNQTASMKLEPGGLASFCSGGVIIPVGFVYGTAQGPAYGGFAHSGANRYDDTIVVSKDEVVFYHVSGAVTMIKK